MTTVLSNLLFLSFRHSSTRNLHKHFSSLNVSQHWQSLRTIAKWQGSNGVVEFKYFFQFLKFLNLCVLNLLCPTEMVRFGGSVLICAERIF